MLMGDRWRVPACGSRLDRTSCPSLKRGTERHGQGLDMPIHLESACEVASTMYKTSFSRVEEIWAV